MGCAFCSNIYTENRIIHDDDIVIAFPTNKPITKGHALISPKRHVSAIHELDNEEVLALSKMVIKISKALRQTLGAEGFNYSWKEGEVAGQTVPHLHIHIVPRNKNDNGLQGSEDHEFLDDEKQRPIVPNEELEKIASLIRKSI